MVKWVVCVCVCVVCVGSGGWKCSQGGTIFIPKEYQSTQIFDDMTSHISPLTDSAPAMKKQDGGWDLGLGSFSSRKYFELSRIIRFKLI